MTYFNDSKLKPFAFPNYVRYMNIDAPVDVGNFSDEGASQYWDELEVEWLKHVQKRRALLLNM